jgi:hypothetical protein
MAVNLSPYGGVGAQFLDNSGNVLTGGKIFTYAAGTTTNQVTYTTSAGNIPHSNPIILDASGRVPSGGEIWLTDGFAYKFILRDANDVLIATYDNVTGINSNFVAFTNQQEIQTATAGQTVFNLTTVTYQPATNSLTVFVDGVNQYGPGAQYAYLETDNDTVTFVNGLHVGAEVKFTTSQLNSSASQSDAFQVSYTPPFTSSVGTNVGDKLAQTVSVMDFGATGDGVTDDTAAIQKAIQYTQAAAVALNNGFGAYSGTAPILYFPKGVYVVTASLTPDTNNAMTYQFFQGDCAIIQAAAGVTVFGGVGYQNKFHGLTFRGGATAISIKTANLDTTMIEIFECEFWRQSAQSIAVDATSGSTLVNVSHSKYVSYSGDGEFVNALSCDFFKIDHCWLSCGAPVCIYFSGFNLAIFNTVGVPYSDLTDLAGTGHWIDANVYSSIHCVDTRFGGEFAGAPIVYWNINTLNFTAYPSIAPEVVFENCFIATGNAGRADRGLLVANQGLPAALRVSGCSGMTDAFFINDQVPGGLPAWLTTLASAPGLNLTIHLYNNNARPNSLSNNPATTTALQPYVMNEVGNSTGFTMNIPNINTDDLASNTVTTKNVLTTTNFGRAYAVTSTPATFAVVDTGIFFNTAPNDGGGYSVASVYDVCVQANTVSGGSGQYRDVAFGTLIVGTGFPGAGPVSQEIFYQNEFAPSVSGINQIAVTAVFWDGASETANVPDATLTTQIRIKIGNYQVGSEGAGTQVRLTRRM